ALFVLIIAGLVIKSFLRLQNVDPGFSPNNALSVKISLPQRKYSEEGQRTTFYNQLLERVRTLPGVQEVGATRVLPLHDDFVRGLNIQGRPPYPQGEGPSTNYYAVTPGYFKAMGIPLLKGRLFDERDTKNSTRVALISESMAKKYFPDEEPIGKRINVTLG